MNYSYRAIDTHREGLVTWYRNELDRLGVGWSYADDWQALGIKRDQKLLENQLGRAVGASFSEDNVLPWLRKNTAEAELEARAEARRARQREAVRRHEGEREPGEDG